MEVYPVFIKVNLYLISNRDSEGMQKNSKIQLMREEDQVVKINLEGNMYKCPLILLTILYTVKTLKGA